MSLQKHLIAVRRNVLMVEMLGTAPKSRMFPRCFNVYVLYITIKGYRSQAPYCLILVCDIYTTLVTLC